MELRTCKTCSEEQPIENFYKGKDGYRNRECKTCHKKRALDRGSEYHLRVWLKSRYGLCPETFLAMREAQNNCCGLCLKPLPARFVVDHDHACCPGHKSCGKCVRALLCYKCNNGLGQFNDSEALLTAAIEYVKRYRH